METQKKFKSKKIPDKLNDKTFDLIKNISYVTTIYSLFISVLYIFGYWSIFNLNIFEYIAISDVIKYSIKPLALLLGIIILISIYQNLLIAQIKQISQLTQTTRKADSPSKQNSRPKLFIFIKGFVKDMKIPSIFFLIWFAFNGPEIKWQIVPFIVSSFIYDEILKLKFIENIKWPSSIKNVVVYLAIFLPLISYPKGREDALKILKGAEFAYLMEKSIDSKKTGCKDPSSYQRIIAQVNDQAITYNPNDKSIAINKLGHGKSLRIYFYTEPIPDHGIDIFFRETWNNIKSYVEL